MPQPLLQLNELPDAPTIHMAIANGFPPETYLPLLKPFINNYRIINLPPRALWENETPPTEILDWGHMADDLRAGLYQYELPSVIGFGHSFGGVASMVAAITKPSLFKALVLLDPTILHPNMLDMIRYATENNVTDQNPLAVRAKRRRNQFTNTEEVYTYMRGKKLFKEWDEEALWQYARSGTIPSKDGKGVQLRWSPEWEGYYFETMRLKVWEDVPKLHNLLPILILRGTESDVYVDESAERVHKMLPNATHINIEGHGHLFPHTAPIQTAEIIYSWLKEQNL